MSELILYIAAAALLVGVIGLLFRRPGARPSSASDRLAASAEFFPVHCRYFPQVRHAFSCEDAPYLSGRGSPVVYRRWRKSMRKAGRLYLGGLREDFSRLNRLARLLSLYSVHVDIRQEAELLRLNLYFHVLYTVIWGRFLLGRPAGNTLEQMATLVATLGRRLERAAFAPELSSGALTP